MKKKYQITGIAGWFEAYKTVTPTLYNLTARSLKNVPLEAVETGRVDEQNNPIVRLPNDTTISLVYCQYTEI